MDDAALREPGSPGKQDLDVSPSELHGWRGCEEFVSNYTAAERAAAAVEEESTYVAMGADVPCCVAGAGAKSKIVCDGCFCRTTWPACCPAVRQGRGRGEGEWRDYG